MAALVKLVGGPLDGLKVGDYGLERMKLLNLRPDLDDSTTEPPSPATAALLGHSWYKRFEVDERVVYLFDGPATKNNGKDGT